MSGIKRINVIGGGPAGLMAADMLASAGHEVVIHDGMPSLGRKLLLAGKSGLNITHSEAIDRFATRFGAANARLAPALAEFGPAAVIAWAEGLGSPTFTGSSGRVFPVAMKASPLLRAWLARLGTLGVTVTTRHRLVGLSGTTALFDTPEGRVAADGDAVILALGGASWPRLGSDAAWVEMLSAQGVRIAPLKPANCGFDVDWPEDFVARFHGAPVRSVKATSASGTTQGEFVISRHGIEGSLVYAHAAALRDQLDNRGQASLIIDLAPGRDAARLAGDIARQPAKASLANRLRKGAGLDPVKLALLRACSGGPLPAEPEALAALIKAMPIRLARPRPIAEAISTAGGIDWRDIDRTWMLAPMPGVFVAGEMIDWEAPTGGYLLTACLATGRAAGLGAAAWLASQADR